MVHFDLNSQEKLLSVLQPHLFAIDPLSRCTNMLFNLSKQSQDIFLVVIVERLYGSDDNSVYVSPGKIHNNSKARADLVQVCIFLTHTILNIRLRECFCVILIGFISVSPRMLQSIFIQGGLSLGQLTDYLNVKVKNCKLLKVNICCVFKLIDNNYFCC